MSRLSTAPRTSVTRCALAGRWTRLGGGPDGFTPAGEGLGQTLSKKRRSAFPRRLVTDFWGTVLRALASIGLLCSAGLPWVGCTCLEPPRTSIPELHVPRAASAPSIDGDLSDWPPSAARTEPFVDTMTGAHEELAPTARLMWDDRALYLAFQVDDPFLRSAGTERDDHLWEEDCVELMLDPDGDEQRYLELQVSPRNVVFDTWFDSRRQPQPFGHVAWSSGLTAEVALRGEASDHEPDEGYTVELRIPWSALAIGPHPIGEAPHAGQTWRVALYALDVREDGQWGAGWSPPLEGDFHVPARFGRVTFRE